MGKVFNLKYSESLFYSKKIKNKTIISNLNLFTFKDKPNSKDEKLEVKRTIKLVKKIEADTSSDGKGLVQERHKFGAVSPDNKNEENTKVTKSTVDRNVDELLEEIERTELKKKSKDVKIDMFTDDNVENLENGENNGNSPLTVDKSSSNDIKPLFPSVKAMGEGDTAKSLFPSAVNIVENGEKAKEVSDNKEEIKDKKINKYSTEGEEHREITTKKKFRISNSVLPKKTSDVPSYTTKYSHYIDGFSNGRTGLGFNENGDNTEDSEDSGKEAVAYGGGLMFTKGETLNEEKKEDLSDIEESVDLLEAKLRFLNEQQTRALSPVQEMIVQMQV